MFHDMCRYERYGPLDIMTGVDDSFLFADKQVSQKMSRSSSVRMSKLSIDKHVGINISSTNSVTKKKSSIKSPIKSFTKSPVKLSGKKNNIELSLNTDRYGYLNGIVCKVILASGPGRVTVTLLAR